ncbi:hypothetical protein ACHAXT_007537 [Thalassiosira profunda]
MCGGGKENCRHGNLNPNTFNPNYCGRSGGAPTPRDAARQRTSGRSDRAITANATMIAERASMPSIPYRSSRSTPALTHSMHGWEQSRHRRNGAARGNANPANDDSANANRQLYVGNIPPGTTEAKLMASLNQAMRFVLLCEEGDTPIVSCKIPRGRFAFVTFSSNEGADWGLHLNGIPYMGAHLAGLLLLDEDDPYLLDESKGVHPSRLRAEMYVLQWEAAVERDETRTNLLSRESAIQLMQDDCAGCGRVHIPGKNAVNGIDRLFSHIRVYREGWVASMCPECNYLKLWLDPAEFREMCDAWTARAHFIMQLCPEIRDEEHLEELVLESDHSFGGIDESISSARKGDIRHLLQLLPGTKVLADLLTRDCFYCGCPLAFGFDRVDPSLSYPQALQLEELGGVTCCAPCNAAKLNRRLGDCLVQAIRVSRHMANMPTDHVLWPVFFAPTTGILTWMMEDRKPVKLTLRGIDIMAPSLGSMEMLGIQSDSPIEVKRATVGEFRTWRDLCPSVQQNAIRLTLGVTAKADTPFSLANHPEVNADFLEEWDRRLKVRAESLEVRAAEQAVPALSATRSQPRRAVVTKVPNEEQNEYVPDVTALGPSTFIKAKGADGTTFDALFAKSKKAAKRGTYSQPLSTYHDSSVCTLVPVPVNATKANQNVWACYRMFDSELHPDLQDRLKCILCPDIEYLMEWKDGKPFLNATLKGHAAKCHEITPLASTRAARGTYTQPLADSHDRSTHHLVPIVLQRSYEVNRRFWECYDKFDEAKHPQLKDRAKCKHCKTEFNIQHSTNGSMQLSDGMKAHAISHGIEEPTTSTRAALGTYSQPLADSHDRSTHHLVPIVLQASASVNRRFWECYDKFDETMHPHLKDRAKCKHCKTEFNIKRHSKGSMQLSEGMKAHAIAHGVQE